MSVVGVLAGDAGQSDDGVAVDADEPAGLADAAALGEVLQDARRPSPRGSWERNSGVPLRSEKRALQALQ